MKRVGHGEPCFWERNNATRWLTQDAERDSPCVFFCLVANPVGAKSFAQRASCCVSVAADSLVSNEIRAPFATP